MTLRALKTAESKAGPRRQLRITRNPRRYGVEPSRSEAVCRSGRQNLTQAPRDSTEGPYKAWWHSPHQTRETKPRPSTECTDMTPAKSEKQRPHGKKHSERRWRWVSPKENNANDEMCSEGIRAKRAGTRGENTPVAGVGKR